MFHEIILLVMMFHDFEMFIVPYIVKPPCQFIFLPIICEIANILCGIGLGLKLLS